MFDLYRFVNRFNHIFLKMKVLPNDLGYGTMNDLFIHSISSDKRDKCWKNARLFKTHFAIFFCKVKVGRRLVS